jgi:hypothetical protein
VGQPTNGEGTLQPEDDSAQDAEEGAPLEAPDEEAGTGGEDGGGDQDPEL